MAQKKESFFWTSYSDLMTSLFFVMLVLFVLVFVVQYKSVALLREQKIVAEERYKEIQKVEESTKDLSKDYFEYRPEYKKYVLNIQGRYPKGESNLNEIIAADKDQQLYKLANAGVEIQDFLKKHNDYKYVLIIEGQASRDDYARNYELSYERALALMRFWAQDRGIVFGNNCEILICGSGDGKLDTHSMRESVEVENQRFLIHILPKNILESTYENS